METLTKPIGRPTDYNPKYCEMIIEFFDVEHCKKTGRDVEAADLPQFTAFAKKIGVSRSTLFKWAREFEEFSNAYSIAKELQEELIVNNALKNRYNPYFSQFLLKNSHGWKDKTEVEQRTQTIEIDDKDKQL